MERGRAYYRHHRQRAIDRKYNILRENKPWALEWYARDKGRLSKGKIHCSCSLCRTKSKDELKFRDKRHLDKMERDLREAL